MAKKPTSVCVLDRDRSSSIVHISSSFKKKAILQDGFLKRVMQQVSWSVMENAVLFLTHEAIWNIVNQKTYKPAFVERFVALIFHIWHGGLVAGFWWVKMPGM